MKKSFFIKGTILLLVSVFVNTSCEDEYDPGKVENYEMSGQWYVRTYVGGTDEANVVLGYTPIVTSNTAAANGEEIIIDDDPDESYPSGDYIWPFRVKADADPSSLTFSANSAQNLYSFVYDTVQNYVTIVGGKITPDGGTSISGVTVDSIYMECTFSEDTTNTTYIMAGHYRTGFTEDEP